ncbi:MAG TPA: ABC transporter permease [Oligoflexia bacterium]|nr:ABC transporter permease [Oligoflexia bacterium]HMR25002.1 ABC transporter permease [Oligoflexia bacterium]
MWNYFIRRLLQTIPIVFGVALITFTLFHFVGGDPIIQLLGPHATASEIARLREQYGLNDPIYVQFFRYLKEIVTLDFGRSFQSHQVISSMIKDGALISLSLTLPAFFMSLIVAIAFSMLSAFYRDTWLDRALVIFSIAGMSISILAFILFGQYILAFQMNLFPVSGYEPGQIQYLLLPWLIWIIVSSGADVRFFRTVFLEELSKDYIRTAYYKGASTARVLIKHALPNAMLPIITRVVINIPFLFLGSLLLENFFSIPGLGSMTVDAFNNADWPVIKAMTVLGSLLYIAGNILSDLLYAKVDPRVRLN